MLEDPSLCGASFTVEVTAILAVELDVSEVEFRIIALCATAVGRLNTALDQFAGIGVRSKVKGRVHTGVLQVKIYAKLHEDLKHVHLGVGGSLVDAVISVNIHQERVQILLQK